MRIPPVVFESFPPSFFWLKKLTEKNTKTKKKGKPGEESPSFDETYILHIFFKRIVKWGEKKIVTEQVVLRSAFFSRLTGVKVVQQGAGNDPRGGWFPIEKSIMNDPSSDFAYWGRLRTVEQATSGAKTTTSAEGMRVSDLFCLDSLDWREQELHTLLELFIFERGSGIFWYIFMV